MWSSGGRPAGWWKSTSTVLHSHPRRQLGPPKQPLGFLRKPQMPPCVNTLETEGSENHVNAHGHTTGTVSSDGRNAGGKQTDFTGSKHAPCLLQNPFQTGKSSHGFICRPLSSWQEPDGQPGDPCFFSGILCFLLHLLKLCMTEVIHLDSLSFVEFSVFIHVDARAFLE